MSEPAGTRSEAAPVIVCLLPVRNGSDHLDRWLDGVARFADAVIALDDGSTDDTRARLDASPLVAKVLTNPPRPTFHGWNDAENRQRLLDAAAELRPAWVVQLDADEEISVDDAAALRTFVLDDSDHGVDAMSLPVHRMIGDDGEWDRIDNSPIRLFRWAPGQQLPGEALHLAPVPTSIPDDRRGVSTLRIRHYAGTDEARRQARYDKYGEVDPSRTWQRSYEHLLDAPGELRAWSVRPPTLPVVANGRAVGDEARASFTAGTDLALSVIVRSPVEEHRGAGLRLLEELGPSVGGEVVDRLAVSSGELLLVADADDSAALGGLSARRAAHLDGWAVVTGTTENTNRRPVGWADYYVDHHQTLPGRPSAPLDGAPLEGTLRRDIVLWLLDQTASTDGVSPLADASASALVEAVYAHGFGAYRVQDVPVRSGSSNRSIGDLVRFHYSRRREPSVHLRELRRRYDIGELRRRNVVRSFVARSRRHLRELTTGLRRWGSGADQRRALVFAPLIGVAYAAELAGSVVAFRQLGRSDTHSVSRDQRAE